MTIYVMLFLLALVDVALIGWLRHEQRAHRRTKRAVQLWRDIGRTSCLSPERRAR